MDYASSLLGLIPTRGAPGLNELVARWSPTFPPNRSTASARPSNSAPAHGPEAPLGRALHRASARRGGHPRRPAPRRRHDRRRDPARRHRRHADREGRHRRALRQRRGRDRRRRHQARPDPVQEPRGSAGRELPQDAAGDGARPARDHGQARRPHAQHAHHRHHVGAEAPHDRARDARDLRAGGRAPRPVLRSSWSSRTSASARSTRSATG